MAHDLRALLREAAGRNADPTAAILDGRTLQSTPESGARAGYDGHKKRIGSRLHAAVDTPGYLLALKVTAANAQEQAQVGELAVVQLPEATTQAGLCRRAGKHLGELPVFVEDPAVPRPTTPPSAASGTSSPAARSAGDALRRGAATRLDLASPFGRWRELHLNLLEQCQSLLAVPQV